MAERRSERTRALALALLTAVLAPAARAGGEAATAEALFRDARALMAKGKYAEACPKLEEAMKLEETGMTAFVLGECLEATGRTASAWARFAEALEFARKKNVTDKLREIEARVAALEPKLARLTLTMKTPPAGLEIHRNGVVVGVGALGSAVPIDPGEYELTVEAPGRAPWKKTISVTPGAKLTVDVPELATLPPPARSAAPAASSTRPDDPPPETRAEVDHTRSYVAMGAGAITALAGGWFMLERSRTIDDIHSLCPETCTPANTPEKDDLRARALRDTWLGAGLLTVGVTAAAVGVVWWKQDAKTQTALRVGPRGLSWEARW